MLRQAVSHQPVFRFAGWFIASALITLLVLPVAQGVEHVSFRRDGQERHVVGKVTFEDDFGGVLLLAPDSRVWIIQSEEIVRRHQDQMPFTLLSDAELAQQLRRDLPDGFRIHQTAHFIIGYNTSEIYAEWIGSLYERLHRGFYTYWKNLGRSLEPHDQRLVVIVFDSRAAFMKYSEPELGAAAGGMFGYYHVETNRVVMFDLTQSDRLQGDSRRIGSTALINRLLSQPEAERRVATIVHEGTHQLAFNSGLQKRFAENPMWVNEGIAVFFETPDLRSKRGWRGIGGVHSLYLPLFRRSLASRTDDPLTRLLTDDKRFRDPQTATQAYADSWALTYYLLKVRRKEYVAYLRALSEQPPLGEVTTAERTARFRQFFGDDLGEFSRQWKRYMQRIR